MSAIPERLMKDFESWLQARDDVDDASSCRNPVLRRQELTVDLPDCTRHAVLADVPVHSALEPLVDEFLTLMNASDPKLTPVVQAMDDPEKMAKHLMPNHGCAPSEGVIEDLQQEVRTLRYCVAVLFCALPRDLREDVAERISERGFRS